MYAISFCTFRNYTTSMHLIQVGLTPSKVPQIHRYSFLGAFFCRYLWWQFANMKSPYFYSTFSYIHSDLASGFLLFLFCMRVCTWHGSVVCSNSNKNSWMESLLTYILSTRNIDVHMLHKFIVQCHGIHKRKEIYVTKKCLLLDSVSLEVLPRVSKMCILLLRCEGRKVHFCIHAKILLFT